jgi:hypothetical protein
MLSANQPLVIFFSKRKFPFISDQGWINHAFPIFGSFMSPVAWEIHPDY